MLLERLDIARVEDRGKDAVEKDGKKYLCTEELKAQLGQIKALELSNSLNINLMSIDARRVNLSAFRVNDEDNEEGDTYKDKSTNSRFGINLSNAKMRRTDLSRSNLRKANLHKADLRKAHMYRTCLKNANLAESKMNHVDASRTDFTDSNLKGAVMNNGEFDRANFEGANFKGVEMVNADLTKANLSGVKNLENSQLEQACTNGKESGKPIIQKDSNLVLPIKKCKRYKEKSHQPSPIPSRK